MTQDPAERGYLLQVGVGPLGSPYGTGNKIHLCKLCFSIDLKYCSHNSRLSLSYREELEGKRCRLQEDLNQSLTEEDEACG